MTEFVKFPINHLRMDFFAFFEILSLNTVHAFMPKMNEHVWNWIETLYLHIFFDARFESKHIYYSEKRFNE